MFLKRSNVTTDRIGAIEKRQLELSQEISHEEKKLGDKKSEIARVLGELALKSSQESESNLKSLRKVVAGITERIEDLKGQYEYLKSEKTKLGLDLCEATVREVPGQLENLAKDFNALLDEGIQLLEAIEVLHKKLMSMQGEFHGMLNKRSQSLDKLNRFEPLNLKEGLGKLAQAGGAYGQAFRVPVEIGNFVSTLRRYREALEGYDKFQKDNPTFDADVKATRERDYKPVDYVSFHRAI